MRWWHLHALFLSVLGTVRAIKELSLEKLDCDDSKDEHEELVDNEYVEDIFQRSYHAIEDSLWREVRTQAHEALGRPVLLPRAEWGHGTTSQPHEKVPPEICHPDKK